jgi:8-oxo-dGTP pyrophosphatase MutT (NUDIX family)
MSIADYEKVLAYVVRPSASGGLELLVFQHPTAGLQVPAGTIDEGESPESAVVRELAEESGLSNVRIVGMLDRYVWTHPRTQHRHHRHVFQFDGSNELPDRWDHVAVGSAEEQGLTFSFRWIPVAAAISQLTGDQGQSLRLLKASTR